MSADKLSFLDDEQDDTEATETEAEAAPEQEEAEGQPEAEEQPEPVESKGEDETPPPGESEETKDGKVPVSALKSERAKRQEKEEELKDKSRSLEEAQRELAELRRWRQQQEAARQQPKPDFFDNPEAVLAQQQQQYERRLMAEKLQQSRFLAEREYGADVVKSAYEWFDQHPEQSQALVHEPSPFHAAVEHYKRQQALSEIGSDPDQWRQAERERLRQEVQAELAQKKPAAPPRSLASAPSAGGETPSPGSAFDELFPG